ncbi:MAG: hypothetical protein EAX96_08825 [Candidatus Lokiarchaeota archaeon]|nr:hypothetical protein [Candidatus Lokiarchaeota archaeon]
MRTGKILPFFLSVLFISAAFLFLVPTIATVTSSGTISGINWEYGETVVNSSTFAAFDDDTMFFESEGTYEYTYNYSFSYESGGYIYEYETMCVGKCDYEGNSTQTMLCNYTIEMGFLADYVKIWTGASAIAEYSWYGMKLGNFYMDYWITDMQYSSYTNQTSNTTYYDTVTKRDASTGEIVSVTYDQNEYWY